ncbi:hypothetical protein Tco_1089626, partial [Tanacetum coccineum]
CFVLVILNPEFEVFQILRTEAQLAAKGYQTAAKKTEVSLVSLSFSAFSSSSLSYEIMIGSSVRESGVKKADLVSFKISDKSSSFTFREVSSAPDSLFALEVVWVVFNPSPADLVLSTRTLRLDLTNIPGSASSVKSAKASCPDADSECKMKEVDQADVEPPAAYCASLCISPTTGVGGKGWLGLVSIAELDLVSFFEWPDWDLDASMVDSDVCFEDCFLLSLLLAPGFLAWGTSSVGEEYLGALESTDTSRLQMAFIWSVKGGSSGWFGFNI